MLERVRQRLLDDPVGRELDPDGQSARLAGDVQLDRKPRFAHLRHEGREVVEARLRRERVVGVRAEHPDQAAHLGEGAAADLLDRLEHLARRAVVLAEDAPFRARLDDHHRHVVRDHVVELAGDPRALLDHRLARGEVALALGHVDPPVSGTDPLPDDHHHIVETTMNGTVCFEACSVLPERNGSRAAPAPRLTYATSPRTNVLVAVQTEKAYMQQIQATP